MRSTNSTILISFGSIPDTSDRSFDGIVRRDGKQIPGGPWRSLALSKVTSCFHHDPGNLTNSTEASVRLKLLRGELRERTKENRDKKRK